MLVLASRSQQRREILERLGIRFETSPADVEELTSGEPHVVARHNALLKASAVPGERVLGVDTLVALDGEIHGKPADAEAARASLRRLAGRTHTVVSGVAIVRAGAGAEAALIATAATRVAFRAIDEATLDWYIACGEWQGRAGGYAIQGRGMALVTSIEGDYSNVVGLPVATLLALAPGLLQR